RAEGDVEEEDQGPAERPGACPAERHAGRTAAAGGRAPDSERDVAVAPLPERRGQDRQCRRCEQCRAEALRAAEDDQRGRRPGEAVEEREDREYGEAG